jgi:hypothetical protein
MTCDGFASHFLWENNPFSLRKVAARTESKPKESSVGGIGLVYASGAGASFRNARSRALDFWATIEQGYSINSG